MLIAYTQVVGRWPSTDEWRSITPIEADLAIEALQKKPNSVEFETAIPPDESIFFAGEPLPGLEHLNEENSDPYGGAIEPLFRHVIPPPRGGDPDLGG